MDSLIYLRSTLESILSECCPEFEFAADRGLVTQGLSSLAATRFALEVEARLGVPVPVAELGRGLTLDDLVALVGTAKGAVVPAAQPGPAEAQAPAAADAVREIPLLPHQQAYLVTSDPGYTADPAGCHIYREVELHGVAADALVQGWRRLMQHHEILRARMSDSGTLRIGPGAEIEVITVPAAGHDAAVAERRAEWESRADRASDTLVAAALVVSPRRVTAHLSIDGLVIDGHGLALLLEQWHGLTLDPTSPLEMSPLTVADCVALLSRPYSGADLGYWQEVLMRAPAGPFADHVAAALASRRDREEAARAVPRRAVDARLSRAEWRRCTERAAELGISPSSLVFAVFSEVILEEAGTRGASFVLTTSERPRLPAGVRSLIGPFTSSMIVPVETEPGAAIDALAVRLHQEIWHHLQHGAVPAVVALRGASAGSAVDRGLAVVFTSLLGLGSPAERGALRSGYATSQTSGVALDHQMWEDDGELVIHWDIADKLLPPFVADLCLARLLGTLRATGVASRPGRKLNPLQRAYLVRRMMGTPGAEDCRATFSMALDGVDAQAVDGAWRDLVEAHDALRMVVDIDGTVRILDPVLRPQVGVTAVGEEELGDRRALLDQVLARRAFSAERWPLHNVHLLTAPSGVTVHLSFDLVALDGKSIHQVVSLLARKLVKREPPGETQIPQAQPGGGTAPPLVADQAARKRYWASKVKSLCSGPDVSSAEQRPRKWTRLSTRIDGYEAFAAACRRTDASPDVVLTAALAHAFHPEAKRGFTIPVVWWRQEDDALRPGELSQMAWAVFDPPEGTPAISVEEAFAGTVRDFGRAIARDLAHGGVEGLEHIGARLMRGRCAAGGRPFALPVVYTSLVEWEPLPAAVAASLRWRTMTPDVSLDAVALAIGGTLVLTWDVVEDDFPPGVAARVFDRYAALAERAVREPAWALRASNRDVERRKVVYEWNDTRRAFPAEGPVQLAFESAAGARPQGVAVRWRGGAWTFARLNASANRIARRLRDLGVEPERKVAIAIDRGPEMIAATLGVLKAGGAYVPIEPSQPRDRAERMCKISDSHIVLSSSGTRLWTLPPEIVRVDVDELPPEAQDAENLPASNRADSTAYLIFTSGSTGEPKAVAVAHRSVHNLLHWCRRTYCFGPDDVGLCITSLGFDLSAFDILGLLGYGAGLYVASAEEQRDPSLLAEILLEQPITFWNSAPNTLAHLRPYFPELAGRPEGRRLRLVFLSGDYTPLSLPPELFATFPNARLVSLGGATEATVWSNYFEVTRIDPSWRSIPYGRPIDNARYYILDERMEPCPVGVEGDLYIAGEVLGLGYYNRPELTAERFVRDPFVSDAAARMYWTGDRALFFEDGVICFRGRADTQVKIRGYRVELEEIEYTLLQHPAITNAVVIVHKDLSGDPKLVAYIQTEGQPDAREVQAFAAAKVPSYMVPNFVHSMKRFPETSNGKLNRKAFPWPLPNGGPAEIQEEPAQSILEGLVEEIQTLFQRFLGSPVDPDVDIWNQGATSFTVLQVSGAVWSSRRTRLQIATLVENPTVRGMARSVLAKLQPAAAVTAARPGPEPGGEQVEVSPESPAGSSPAADAVVSGALAATPKFGGPSGENGTGSSATGADRETVDVLDGAAKAAFLSSGARHRSDLDAAPRISLPLPEVPLEWRNWRGAHRDFHPETVGLSQLGTLLGLLAPATVEGRSRHLFPSAGETYSVQTYLWIRGGRVTGLDPGYYWFDGEAGALIRTGPTVALDRSVQSFYNRPIFDAAAAVLFLVGEYRGIEPLYGPEARRFLLLEAGYMGQLLLLGQRNAGLGLCPIGTFDTRPVAAALGLGESHEMLHSFLVGCVPHETGRAGVLAPLPLDVRPRPPVPQADAAPIAIVGQAGRYPGAESPEALWKLLCAGTIALHPAPRRRGLGGAAAGLIGGFLDDIESFDPLTFAIAPSEIRSIDPQARLLLEVIWECLERSGHSPASLQHGGERTGVFVGHLWQDYGHVGADLPEDEPARIAAVGSELADRICHAFGFTGPSLAVDTGCCSALTALHLAVSAIRRGECDSAIACGVNLLAHPYHARVLRGLGLVAARAPSGAYDCGTAGWAVGEGAGALLLRRTTAHGAASDTVLALVEATHIEHAGGRAPFGSPSSQAIQAALRATVAAAGLTPEDIDYVECAASGAAITDAAEWQALAEVFPSGVQVGTLKPNIGHLEAASGLSQIAKALLQIEHGELAPTRVAPEVSSLIDATSGPLQIVESVTAFRATGRPRRIVVNAVAATGSLAQLILVSPPTAPAAAQQRAVASGPPILLLSAASKPQVDELAARFAEFLETRPDAEWLDICATTQLSRSSWRFRLAVEAPGRAEALQSLRAFLAGREAPALRWSEADPGLAHQRSSAAEHWRAREDWLTGYEVDWAAFWSGDPRRVRLPTYPFARQKSWAAEGARPAATAWVAGHWIEVVRGAYSQAAEIPAAELDPHTPLERYGLCSRIATQVAAELNRHLGRTTLPATLLYEHRDLASVAGAVSAVATAHAAPERGDAPAPARPAAPRSTSEPVGPSREWVCGQPVAIVGLAGRYPGAPDVETLWRRLLAGDDLVAGPPAGRVELDRASGLLHGAFLDDVASFDPFLFGITPDDATRMDPQERLILEVVWEALEDACWPPARLKAELGGQVGVFAGVMHNEYPLLGVELSTPEGRIDAGATPAGVANRISYHLDLAGPSLTVDTMCSSSLTALHQAVEALRAARIKLAIVGGTNLSLHPNKFVQQARLRMTSSDRRCRSFGAGGDGFIPGEGVGVVVLRRLDDAERDGDRIHGVIRGTAMNHGGKVNGFTVPSPQAQSRVIAAALADAGVAPDTISYVEAHGTGTALGDPIEARALSEALALLPGSRPLAIGSVKSNIGHLEAAAGIAGVTKVLLQMRHRTLVASLHSANRNPEIDWTHLRIPQAPEPWEPRREGGRDVWRAGVSSFGAGGTNLHVVLEAYTSPEIPVVEDAEPQVLVLSTATSEALTAAAQRLADFLQSAGAGGPSLADVAATLQLGREPLSERWTAVCRDRGDAVRHLLSFAAGGQAGHRGRAQPGATAVRADADPETIAAQWATGAEVDWASRSPRQHRRVALPSYPFTRMRCWIDPRRHATAFDTPAGAGPRAEPAAPANGSGRRADGQGVSSSPPALAQRVWRPDPSATAGGGDEPSLQPVLVLVTRATERLGRELTDRLGPSRARAMDAAHWGLPGQGATPETAAVVLLGDLDPAPRPEDWRGPFEACRALARRSAVTPLHILQVASGLLAPSTDGPAGSGALLAGLLHGLAAERAAVTATVLDVGPVDLESRGSRQACGEAIISELGRRTSGDVCVTRLGRLVPAWEPAPPANAEEAWVPRADALYLVTGGTRGIGARLARELVRRGARRLAVIGRSRSGASEETVQGLRAAGAVVEVHYGRVEDREVLDAWLRAVEARMGPLVGIFHCAGVPSARGGSLLDVRLDELAAVAAPKVGGLAALLPAISRSQPEVVVAFSSISAVVPAVSVGVGDYAAANSATEYVADQQRGRGSPALRTIAWPVWESSTASEEARGCMSYHGLPVLSDRDAFDLLWSAVTRSGSGRFAAVDSRVLAMARPQAAVASPPSAAGGTRNGPAPADGAPDWLAELIADRIGMPVHRLDRATTFDALGIESVMLGRLVQDIEARVGRPVDPSFVLAHPTVEQLGAALSTLGPLAGPPLAPRGSPLPAVKAPPAPDNPGSACRAVAIVGMAVRVPGAPTTAAFWDLLVRGACAVGQVPPGRWDARALFDPEGRPGTSNSRWGGFLDDIEAFDPEWFQMTEEEARCLDPAIRLLLEGAAVCLSDSGRRPEDLSQHLTGVFVGGRQGDYRLRIGRPESAAGLGADQNFMAARLAKHFDLHGPNLVVDSACSSALTAVHLACQSLLLGESDLALAGGADVLLDEAVYLQFTAARALSRSGRCRTFDKAADGFVPGEGCGVFLLKRLDEALRDGDRIWAVVEGSAVNSDGRTMGLTTPNPAAQRDVVSTALARAGRSPREIGLVEAHGTATMIGDPIELRALAEVFQRETQERGFCGIGSVKTNIGHLLCASGAAGLAKAVLAVRHGEIPPTLFCETPNPRFDLARSPFFIPQAVSPWRTRGRRLASVSAFGLGGTNAHMVISQAPPHIPRREPLTAPQFRRRRLWLERTNGGTALAQDETLSLLDLSFVEPEPSDAPRAPGDPVPRRPGC